MEMSNMTPKSFWERKEGKTGMVFLGAGIVGGIYALYAFLPFIITMLQNTLHAIFLLGIVGLIVFLACDSRVRTLVSYFYKVAMRWITGAFVQLDPIAIVEAYVSDLEKNLQKMDQQIGNLKGQMRNLQNTITTNEKVADNNLKLASKAKEVNNITQVMLQSRKAGRKQKSNLTLKELYVKMEKLYRVLTKMFETASVMIEDTKDDVETKKIERAAILKGHSAFKSAMKVISGDPEKLALFNQAMDYMVEDIGNKVGEMERFMEVSANFIDSVDLQNGVFEADGLDMLDSWEKDGGLSLLLKPEEKQMLLTKAEDPNDIINLDAHPEKVLVKASIKNKQYEEFLR